jgi:hypothetical protein
MSKRQSQSIKKTKPASASSSSPKLSSAAKFTFFLLGVMFLLGATTGYIGYLFGRNSLKGITQPDLNPFLNSTADATAQTPRQGVSFLKEDELIKKVLVQTRGASSKPVPKTEKKTDGDKTDQKDAKKPEPKKGEAKKADGSFPIRLESEKVKLDIRSVVQRDDEIILSVAMTNGGSQPIQFIYTFLDISDHKGYSLTSEVIGIPETLKANSETHVGTIRVLDTPPGAATGLNLKLTDYPDQKINLEIKDVPVPKKE